MHQLQFGEHRSDSLYFTPSGTPMREIIMQEDTQIQSVPGSNIKNTHHCFNEFSAYKEVYGHQSDSKKTHRRGRSLSQFLPFWFSGGAVTESEEKQDRVEVEVTNSNANTGCLTVKWLLLNGEKEIENMVLFSRYFNCKIRKNSNKYLEN